MAAKEIKRLEANARLMAEIAESIKAAHEAGLSTDDVKATIERFVSLLEEE